MAIFILMRGFDSLTSFAKIVVVLGMNVELLDVLKMAAFLLESWKVYIVLQVSTAPASPYIDQGTIPRRRQGQWVPIVDQHARQSNATRYGSSPQIRAR